MNKVYANHEQPTIKKLQTEIAELERTVDGLTKNILTPFRNKMAAAAILEMLKEIAGKDRYCSLDRVKVKQILDYVDILEGKDA